MQSRKRESFLAVVLVLTGLLGVTPLSAASLAERVVVSFSCSSTDLPSAAAKLAAQEHLLIGIESKPALPTTSRAAEPRVSIRATGKTVQQILESLAAQDPSYVWAASGDWINVFPKQYEGDQAYLYGRAIPGTVKITSENPDCTGAVKAWCRENRVSFSIFGSRATLQQHRQVQPTVFELKNPTFREVMNRRTQASGRTYWSSGVPRVKNDGRILVMYTYGTLFDAESAPKASSDSSAGGQGEATNKAETTADGQALLAANGSSTAEGDIEVSVTYHYAGKSCTSGTRNFISYEPSWLDFKGYTDCDYREPTLGGFVSVLVRHLVSAQTCTLVTTGPVPVLPAGAAPPAMYSRICFIISALS